MLVLIVDDNPVELETARQELETAGYEVATLDSPFGVAAFVLSRSPGVVVVDVQMPALSGDRITTFLKERVPSGVRVVLHSGRPAAELSALTAECGADAYVSKGTGSLTATVRKLAG